MDTATKPIIATTTLSLLVHSMLAAAMLLAYGQVTRQDEGVGHGVEIQLVSSVQVSDQPVADLQVSDLQVPELPVSTQAVATVSSENPGHSAKQPFAEKVLASLNNPQVIAATEPEKNARTDINRTEQLIDIEQQAALPQAVLQQAAQPRAVTEQSVATFAQATNASQQQHAILELLHQRISDNKEYPYLARKQGREGVATVAFVLHPDGSIENAHLVSSSRAQVLDRAALSAVKKIAPFKGAQQYLQQSETFQVAVEFNLL